MAILLLSALTALGALPGLPADRFSAIPDALALVRLRLLQRADLGCLLPDRLLVDALHPYEERTRVGLLTDLERDPRLGMDLHRVGVAHGHAHRLAHHLRPEPHAHDVQHLLVPVADALHHV